MKITSSEIINSELVNFHYINIFCKKLEYGIKPNSAKDRIRPPLVIFLKNAEIITTTGSSANFLSPKPNGQGYNRDLRVVTV